MKTKGFTLIELLIVVAIIAILAAIAVPNFLEAQTRAKVTRMKANMRTVATAIEMYTIDNNVIPLTTANGPGGGSNITGNAATPPFGPKPPGLPNGNSWIESETWKLYPGYPDQGYAAGVTTPISYVSSSEPMRDIFRQGHNFTTELENQIMYLPSNWYRESIRDNQTARYGSYVMRSAGPDTWYQNHFDQQGDYGSGGWSLASYEATNGTISGGDIYRSQKDTDEDHI